MAQDTLALARFQREAQAASVLNHPNICMIYDIDEQDGKAFIAMEYLEGVTLEHLMALGPMEVGDYSPSSDSDRGRARCRTLERHRSS